MTTFACLMKRSLLPVAACAAVCAGCAGVEGIRARAVSDGRAATEALFSPAKASGEAAAVAGPLTLEGAVKLALERNHDYRAVLVEKKAADARLWQAWSGVMPRVTAGGSYTRLDKSTKINVGGAEMTIGAENNYSLDATVAQPLFHGGAIRSGIKTARIAEVMTGEALRSARQGTVFLAAKSYYDTVLAGHLLRVREDAVKSAEGHLADVENMKAQGLASDYDVLRAQVEVSNFRAAALKQKNDRDLALAALLDVCGLPQSDGMALADDLEYVPVPADFREAAKLAMTCSSAMLQARLTEMMKKEAVWIARSGYAPQVDAFFKYSRTKPDSRTLGSTEWGAGWTAGASLTWPLFDGLFREGKIDEARAALEQARIRLEGAEERTILDIRKAILELGNADEFVESQKLSLKRAEEGLRLVEAGYKQGMNTEVQVTDARGALTAARAFHYQAVYAHIMARLNLKLAMGMLEPQYLQKDGVPGAEKK